MVFPMTPTPLPGHPHVHTTGGALHVEGVSVAALAQAHGTPLFVYSKASMLAALAAYQRGFAGRRARIHYAMKANSSLHVRAAASISSRVASCSACWPPAVTRPR